MTIRILASNAVWVGVLQVFNHLPTLLVLPILARAIGPHEFGIYAQLLAYGAFVSLIVEYGFNFTATREAARLRHQLPAVTELAAGVLGSKLILASLASAGFLLLAGIVGVAKGYFAIAVLVLLQVLAAALTPTWLFMGLERVRPLAIVHIVCKLSAVIAIFLLVRSPDDLVVFAGLHAAAAVGVLGGAFFVLKALGIGGQLPAWGNALEPLKRSGEVFLATVAINVYTASVVLVVGGILGPVAAGNYALADRVRQAMIGMFGPATQAIYPFICRTVAAGETRNDAQTRRLLFGVLVFGSLVLSLAAFVYARDIVELLGGGDYPDSVGVLRAMSVLPFLVTMSNILSTQTMLPNGMYGDFLKLAGSAATFGLVATALFCLTWGVQGAAMAVVATECVVIGISTAMLARRGLLRGVFVAAREP